jgi:RNA polymerase sigma factor (sigma-70 family)
MREPGSEQPKSEAVLVAVYETLVRYWLSRHLPRDKAEDLAQEGVLKCLQQASKWRGKASLKTFWVKVGKNAGLDYLRKESRREKIMQRSSEKAFSLEDENL